MSATIVPANAPVIVYDPTTGDWYVSKPGGTFRLAYDASDDKFSMVTAAGAEVTANGSLNKCTMSAFEGATVTVDDDRITGQTAGGAAVDVDGDGDTATLATNGAAIAVYLDGANNSASLSAGGTSVALDNDTDTVVINTVGGTSLTVDGDNRTITKSGVAGEFDTGRVVTSVPDATQTTLQTINFAAMPSGLGHLGNTGNTVMMTWLIEVTDPTAAPGTTYYKAKQEVKVRRSNAGVPAVVGSVSIGGISSFPGTLTLEDNGSNSLLLKYTKDAAYASSVESRITCVDVYEVNDT